MLIYLIINVSIMGFKMLKNRFIWYMSKFPCLHNQLNCWATWTHISHGPWDVCGTQAGTQLCRYHHRSSDSNIKPIVALKSSHGSGVAANSDRGEGLLLVELLVVNPSGTISANCWAFCWQWAGTSAKSSLPACWNSVDLLWQLTQECAALLFFVGAIWLFCSQLILSTRDFCSRVARAILQLTYHLVGADVLRQ